MDFILDSKRISGPILLVYKWTGNIDMDLSSLSLSKEGILLEKNDFVFYNSNNRTPTFDKSKYRNISRWKNLSSPLSGDGSIELLNGDEMFNDQDYSEASTECMIIRPHKIRENVKKIVFSASSYNCLFLNSINNCEIRLYELETMKLLTSLDISSCFHHHSNSNALIFCELNRIDNNVWDFRFICDAYSRGLLEIVNHYL